MHRYFLTISVAILCVCASSKARAQSLGVESHDSRTRAIDRLTRTPLTDPLADHSIPLIHDDESQSEFITRFEYERLRGDFEELSSAIENLRRASQVAETRLTAHPQPMAEEIGWGYVEPQCVCNRVPGWERARSPCWMSQGRLQRMTTQIGQAGDMDLYLGLNTVGRPQYLQQSNVFDTVGPNNVVPGALEPGIQTPFGQFLILADFGGAIEVYMDVFIASRPHEDLLQADEGFMLFRQLPGPFAPIFDFVHIKAGGFEMDFGDAHYRRSNNADVQRNPLIGNYVIDPREVEIGAEFFNPPGSLPINWLFGVGVGNTGDFQAHRGWQFHGKLYAETCGGFRPSVSFFRADHAGNPTGFPNTGSKSDLFRSNRSGGPYAAVLGAGNAPGQILPGNGQDVSAVQVDLSWFRDTLELYGHFGMFLDADTNGSAPGTPTESWLYYTGEGIYRFTPYMYAAARYSGASALHLVSALDNTQDVKSGGVVHRFQIGGGYWLHDMILAKLEYVYQFYDSFTPDGSQVSGVDVWRNPTFNGVLMEISFTF